MRILRSHAAEFLPDYMVPAAFTPLDKLPVNTSGKIDAVALTRPRLRRPQLRTRPARPREELPCALFAEALGVAGATIDDDFFALGGDSITAIRVLAGRRAAGLRLTSRDVFRHRTVAELVGVVADLSTETAQEAGDPRGADTTGLDVEELLPLSPSRRGSTSTRSPTTTTPTWSSRSWSSTGTSTPTRLRPRGGEAGARHAPLRACFRPGADGRPVQVILREVGLPWREEPLTTSAPRSEPGRSTWPTLPLLRCALIEGRKLVLTVHHIVADGWSLPVLHRELWRSTRATSWGRSLPYRGIPAQPRRTRPRERPDRLGRCARRDRRADPPDRRAARPGGPGLCAGRPRRGRPRTLTARARHRGDAEHGRPGGGGPARASERSPTPPPILHSRPAGPAI